MPGCFVSECCGGPEAYPEDPVEDPPQLPSARMPREDWRQALLGFRLKERSNARHAMRRRQRRLNF